MGSDLATGVETALRRYADDLGSDREPLAFPAFRRQQPQQASAADLELALDTEVQEALEGEVRRQDVPLEQLVAHAVFLCLASLDRAAGPKE